MQILKLPDPSADKLWLHVTRFHNSSIPDWPDEADMKHVHMMQHVRGKFTSMHFHLAVEGPGDDKSRTD
jgi:hypothetical protein